MMGDLLRQTAGQREREDSEREQYITLNSTSGTERSVHTGADAITSSVALPSCESQPPITENYRKRVFKFCFHCGRSVYMKLTACSHCHKVFYCFRTCKLNAWNERLEGESIQVSASADGIQRRFVFKSPRGPRPLIAMLKFKTVPRPLSVKLKSLRVPWRKENAMEKRTLNSLQGKTLEDIEIYDIYKAQISMAIKKAHLKSIAILELSRVSTRFFYSEKQKLRDGEFGDGWFVGDSAYPLHSFLLTPVLNPTTAGKIRYNEAHICTPNIVERTFGILKSRFRCLDCTGGALLYRPEKVAQIVVTCCMLHNITKQHGLEHNAIPEDAKQFFIV
ncbi:hypothetical protein ABVT39_005720 [Epinephelus coioides]